MRSLADPAIASSIVQRLQRLTPAAERRWGSMTAHQMLAHVAGAAEAAAGKRPFAARRRASPMVARLLKAVFLYGPFRWPHSIKTGANPAGAVLDPATFEAERARTIAAVEALAAPSGAFGDAHPMFGPMSPADWRRYGFVHTDHHLRQFGV